MHWPQGRQREGNLLLLFSQLAWVSANRAPPSPRQPHYCPSVTLLGPVCFRGQVGSAKGEFPHSPRPSWCDPGQEAQFHLSHLSHHSNIPFVIFLGSRIGMGGPSPPANKRHVLPTFLLTSHPISQAHAPNSPRRGFASCSSPHRSNPTWILNAPIV